MQNIFLQTSLIQVNYQYELEKLLQIQIKWTMHTSSKNTTAM